MMEDILSKCTGLGKNSERMRNRGDWIWPVFVRIIYVGAFVLFYEQEYFSDHHTIVFWLTGLSFLAFISSFLPLGQLKYILRSAAIQVLIFITMLLSIGGIEFYLIEAFIHHAGLARMLGFFLMLSLGFSYQLIFSSLSRIDELKIARQADQTLIVAQKSIVLSGAVFYLLCIMVFSISTNAVQQIKDVLQENRIKSLVDEIETTLDARYEDWVEFPTPVKVIYQSDVTILDELIAKFFAVKQDDKGRLDPQILDSFRRGGSGYADVQQLKTFIVNQDGSMPAEQVNRRINLDRAFRANFGKSSRTVLVNFNIVDKVRAISASDTIGVFLSDLTASTTLENLLSGEASVTLGHVKSVIDTIQANVNAIDSYARLNQQLMELQCMLREVTLSQGLPPYLEKFPPVNILQDISYASGYQAYLRNCLNGQDDARHSEAINFVRYLFLADLSCSSLVKERREKFVSGMIPDLVLVIIFLVLLIRGFFWKASGLSRHQIVQNYDYLIYFLIFAVFLFSLVYGLGELSGQQVQVFASVMVPSYVIKWIHLTLLLGVVFWFRVRLATKKSWYRLTLLVLATSFYIPMDVLHIFSANVKADVRRDGNNRAFRKIDETKRDLFQTLSASVYEIEDHTLNQLIETSSKIVSHYYARYPGANAGTINDIGYWDIGREHLYLWDEYNGRKRATDAGDGGLFKKYHDVAGLRKGLSEIITHRFVLGEGCGSPRTDATNDDNLVVLSFIQFLNDEILSIQRVSDDFELQRAQLKEEIIRLAEVVDDVTLKTGDKSIKDEVKNFLKYMENFQFDSDEVKTSNLEFLRKNWETVPQGILFSIIIYSSFWILALSIKPIF